MMKEETTTLKIPSDAQAIIEAARQSIPIENRVVDDDVPYALVRTSEGITILETLMKYRDERAEAPRRLKGTSTHHELQSFTAHVKRFKDVGSVIWADINKTKLTAILNYNLAASEGSQQHEPRWGDYRAVYTCPLTKSWQLWNKYNDQGFKQDDFGQFIEDNLPDVANVPDDDKESAAPATLIQVARNLVIHSKTQFERVVNPSTGEGTFHWKKDNENTGLSTRVPTQFRLALQPFEAGAVHIVVAKLRYRVKENGGGAMFSYLLQRPEDVLREAFDKVREQAQAETGLPVYAGEPE